MEGLFYTFDMLRVGCYDFKIK